GRNPSFAVISMIDSNSNSVYHGGMVHLKRPFRRGFNFEAAYTFGKAIDDCDTLGSSTSGNPTYADAANRRLERGIAGYDVPQKLSLLGIWEIPFLRGQKNMASRVIGGWNLSGVAIFQSGLPMDITNGAAYPRGDYNADGNTGDRPNAP